MSRRVGLTLFDLLVFAVIFMILATLIMSCLVNRSLPPTMIESSLVVTPQKTFVTTPTEVHVVDAGFGTAASIKEVVAQWVKDHPTLKIVDFLLSKDNCVVILAERK